MNSFAGCTIVGWLTRDAELKYLATGMAVAHFSLATSEKVKGNEESSFWDCHLWGKQAETLAQYLTKRKQIVAHGTMKMDAWEKDGEKKTKLKINVQTIALLSGGEKASSQGPAQPETHEETIPF